MKRAAQGRSQKKTIRAVWAAIFGMFVFLFGIGGCEHSRWETRAEAARIGYKLHPWAIIAGLVITIGGFVIAKREKKLFDSQR